MTARAALPAPLRAAIGCARVFRHKGPSHMKVRVFVNLKPGVLDPQGRAVHHALEGLGFEGVEDVRIGRMIELETAPNTTDETLDAMCRKLLANTVIEDYRTEKMPETEGAA